MSYKFRNELLNSKKEFNNLLSQMLSNKEITEFDDELWNVISRDKTSIRINKEPLAFKDFFHLDLNEGRCKSLVIELLLLLDKIVKDSEAVECINE